MPKITASRTMQFPWPNDPHKGQITIRHLKEGELTAIHAKCASAVNAPDPDSEGMIVTQRHDIGQQRELICQSAIHGWENFLGPDGQPMECTPDNKKLFALEDGYYTQLNVFRDKLAGIIAAEEKKAAKK